MEFNRQELANFFNTTIGTVKTNFPKLRQRALKQGYLIQKRGSGENSIYEVTKTEPKNISVQELSTYKKEIWQNDLPNEIWTSVYFDNDYEVSNLGRIRRKKDLMLRKLGLNNGYQLINIKDKTYRVNRIVMFSFNNIEDPENYEVDHIDGNRSNNSLSNLRLVTRQQNNKYKIKNRSELDKIFTQLLYNHTYEEIINYLKKMPNN